MCVVKTPLWLGEGIISLFNRLPNYIPSHFPIKGDEVHLEERPELIDRNMGREIERFLEFTGCGPWQDQIEKLTQQLSSKKCHFYKVWLQKRNPFLVPLREYFRLTKEGKSIWKNASPRLKYLAKQICVLNILVRNLNSIARNRILGRLRDPSGIRSFLFELQIATHFLVRGFDVYFIDLESSSEQGSYDFLVKNQYSEIEIECKRKSYDAGRKVTREGFYLLADAICSETLRRGQNFAVNIVCQDNLGRNHHEFQKFAESIRCALDSKEDSVNLGPKVSAKISYLPSGMKISSNEEAARILSPNWIPDAHYAVVSGKKGTIIIRTESQKRDMILKAIFEELEKGSDQLTKTRPSILACYIEEIEEDEWELLKDEGGLVNMAGAFFVKDGNKHVNMIAYSSDADGENAYQRDFTKNLIFTNLKPKFEIKMKLFGGSS